MVRPRHLPGGAPPQLAEPTEEAPPEVAVVTTSAAGTQALAALIAALLEPGDVLLLSGGLGAGKTTFTKGLVAALGSDEPVTSPTFTLLRTYRTDPVVAHVDCWRLDQLDEVADLALDEILDDGGVAVIEWGEVAAPLLGRDALEVLIAPVAPDAAGTACRPAGRGAQPEELPEPSRLVCLRASSASWRPRLARLAGSARDGGLEVVDGGPVDRGAVGGAGR